MNRDSQETIMAEWARDAVTAVEVPHLTARPVYYIDGIPRPEAWATKLEADEGFLRSLGIEVESDIEFSLEKEAP